MITYMCRKDLRDFLGSVFPSEASGKQSVLFAKVFGEDPVSDRALKEFAYRQTE